MKRLPKVKPYAYHVFVCMECAPEGRYGELCAKMIDLLGEHMKVSRPDHVKVNVSPCLSICGAGPLVLVYPSGTWYHHVDEAVIERIVHEHLINHRPIAELALPRPFAEQQPDLENDDEA